MAIAAATGASAKEKEAERSVSAEDPETILEALDSAGYTTELSADDAGDPRIKVTLTNWSAWIYFYGCLPVEPKSCSSLHFSSGFDREEPWTAEEAIKISAEVRFASIWLDDEGDPYVTWDLATNGGMSRKAFLSSVRHYEHALDDAADLIFPDDPAEKERPE